MLQYHYHWWYPYNEIVTNNLLYTVYNYYNIIMVIVTFKKINITVIPVSMINKMGLFQIHYLWLYNINDLCSNNYEYEYFNL